MTELKSQAEILLGIADELELLHTADQDAYVSILLDHGLSVHRETWSARGQTLRSWLTREFFRLEGKPPSSEAMKGAIGVVEARAIFEGELRPVHTRVAATSDAVYLDLCDEAWRVVEIDRAGWRVLNHSPVHFRRPKSMLPLPQPVPGGSIELLRPLLNVESDDDWRLYISWETTAAGGRGPYPVLALHGEQGSSKSTHSRISRALVDPSTAPLRSPPRNEDALMIAARNGRVIAIDNVSELTEWQADALCRLATGGGVSKRQLYTDDGEIIFDSIRPILLNGITEFATRGDLADRSIVITLPTIPDEKRRHERHIWKDFEAIRPQILGAILTGVSHSLRDADTVSFDALPRMADFAMEAAAAAPSFGWTSEDFMRAYAGNRGAAVEAVLEGDVVAQAIITFMEGRPEWEAYWEGTASELLQELEKLVTERVTKSREWPGPRGLSGQLRRLAPILRRKGLNIGFTRRARKRTIRLEKADGQPSQPSLPSPSHQPSQAKPLSDKGHDGSDANDGREQHISTDRHNGHPDRHVSFEEILDRIGFRGAVYRTGLVAAFARENGVDYSDAEQAVNAALEAGELERRDGDYVRAR